MKRCFFCSAPSYGDQTISSIAFKIMRKKEPRLTRDTIVCAACFIRTQHYAEKFIEKAKEKKGSHNSNVIVSSQSNVSESTTLTKSASSGQITSTQSTGEVSIESPSCNVRTRQKSDSESSNMGISYGLPRIRRRQKSPDPPANLNQRDAANYHYIKRNSINFGG